ncbi:MAG: flavin reductase family protein [Pseudomonadota bacterium]
MRFEPGNHKAHGLTHDPFKAIVSPRPIGWISTRAKSGAENVAPYSFYNAVAGKPPIVMFSSEGQKDSVTFARETGVFAANFTGDGDFEVMNDTSAPLERGVSEFEQFGLSKTDCYWIDCPMVASAPAVLECRVIEVKQLHDLDQKKLDTWTVFGQVVGIHIAEQYVSEGRFDVSKSKPLTRLGYRDFAQITSTFEAKRPGE